MTQTIELETARFTLRKIGPSDIETLHSYWSDDIVTERLTDFTFYSLEKCGHSPWKEKYAAGRFYEILNAEITDVPRKYAL